MRRDQLVWGVILLLLGGLMLANQMGVRLPNGVSLMDLFWPLVLLLGGAWILLGVYFSGSVQAEKASIELQGAGAADLHINHGAGELKIHSGAGSAILARGTFVGGLDQKTSRIGDRLEVRMRPARDILDFPFLGRFNQLDWDVSLNSDIPLNLTLNLGANKSVLDFKDLKITGLKLETGASDTRLTLPASGRFHADLDLGAAAIEVTVPDGVSARIRASLGAADLKIDEARFPRVAGYYQSPDFESSANSVDMTIDAGAASIRVR